MGSSQSDSFCPYDHHSRWRFWSFYFTVWILIRYRTTTLTLPHGDRYVPDPSGYLTLQIVQSLRTLCFSYIGFPFTYREKLLRLLLGICELPESLLSCCGLLLSKTKGGRHCDARTTDGITGCKWLLGGSVYSVETLGKGATDACPGPDGADGGRFHRGA